MIEQALVFTWIHALNGVAMNTYGIDVKFISVAEGGGLIFDDARLDAFIKEFGGESRPGQKSDNDRCTNGSCDGSSNQAFCRNNRSCDNSTNSFGCSFPEQER